ncbi:MAG: RNA polymerase sigma factor [Candidatus Paceibacterota bacterium]|jgi:RNA polymerase sigma-70 factor (ECF subfamily)
METLQKTFFESYKSHSDEIFRFVFFKLNDREKSKDLVQEVFMKTWIYITKNGNIGNIRAFLYKTASNAVIDEYRKKERGWGRLSSLENLSEEFGYDPGFDDTDSIIDKIDGEKAMKLIKELPEIYAEVVFLRFVENKSITEIAEITNRSENAISVQLNRGIKKLKEIIQDKFKI